MNKNNKKIPSFTVKSGGITLVCATLILLVVSLIIGVVQVADIISQGGYENLNENLISQQYDSFADWLNLIVPQIVFALTVFWSMKRYNINFENGLKLNFKIPVVTVFASIILVFCSLYVGEMLNLAVMQIPGMSSIERNLSTAFYFDEGWKFAIALIVVGLLPAIGEEVLFRGAVLFGLAKKNKFMAIFYSAFLFALMHGNPIQFFYPFVMGVVMGYTDIVSNSIFPSVIMHAVNNIFVMFMTYFEVPLSSGVLFSVIVGFASVAIIIAVLWLLTIYYFKKFKKKFPEKLYGSNGETGKSYSFGDEFTLYEEGDYLVKKEGKKKEEKKPVKEKDIEHLSGKSRPSAVLDLLFYDYETSEVKIENISSEEETAKAVNIALAEISADSSAKQELSYKPGYSDEVLQRDNLLKKNRKRYNERIFEESEKKKENSFGGFIFATAILMIQFILNTVSLL